MPQPERIQIELSAYLDGELAPKQARRIEALLAKSPEARRTLEALQHARDAVASLPCRSAPPALRSHVRRQIERLSLLDRPAAQRRAAVLAWRSALSAAAVVAAAIGLWWAFKTRPQAAPPSGPAAVVLSQPAPPGAPAQPKPPDRPARRTSAVAKPVGDRPLAHGAPKTPAPPPDHTASAEPGSHPEPVRTARAPAGHEPAAPPAVSATKTATAASLVTMPRIQVVVQPDDITEYRAVQQVLKWWSHAPGNDMPRVETAAAARDAAGHQDGTGPASVAGPSTPVRTRLLLERLRAVAPERVRITLSFAPRDLDTVRAILEPPDAEPFGRLLTFLEAPVFAGEQNLASEPLDAERLAPQRPGLLAMQAYEPVSRNPRAAGATANDETIRLAALKSLDAGQATLRLLSKAPAYARAAGETVEWTARRLFARLRQELVPIRVELKLLTPQPSRSASSDRPTDG